MYGKDIVKQLKRKIERMNQYANREPRFGPNYMFNQSARMI